jgi:hypothetical protein
MPEELRAIIGAGELVLLLLIGGVFVWRYLRRLVRKRARKERLWRNLEWSTIDEEMPSDEPAFSYQHLGDREE